MFPAPLTALQLDGFVQLIIPDILDPKLCLHKEKLIPRFAV